jgi:hypothetical protein
MIEKWIMELKAEGIICIPDGKKCFMEGERVNVQLLAGWYV